VVAVGPLVEDVKIGEFIKTNGDYLDWPMTDLMGRTTKLIQESQHLRCSGGMMKICFRCKQIILILN
jgi:hypothetical protein